MDNCGPNTMYNNGTYDYINYDTVLGVPIDTEGTSLEIFGQSQVNNNLALIIQQNFFQSMIKIIHSIVYHQNVVWER